MSETRPRGSEYMHWAKTRSAARFNLATSGMPNLPLSELPVTIEELEITGGDGYGYGPLVEAIAAKSRVSTASVVTAAGTSMANHLALAALLEPGDEALVEHPVYDPIERAARYAGASVRHVPRRPENDFRIDPEEVARLVTPRTKVVALTNLHNPTSARDDEETLAAVAEVARRAGGRLVVDEVYLDAAFEHATHSAVVFGPDVVVTNSLTKVYGLSGLRCGWILADPETARRMWLLNDIYAATPAHPAERIAVVAFRHLERLRERARRLLATNRHALHAFYDARDDLEAPRFAWGTTSFPRVTTGPVARLCEILRDRYETSVVPGSFFGAPDRIRIGLTADPETFAEGLSRLASALDDLRRG
jgi:aspartate/methionine/tyrosine aminotransferase